WNQGVIEATSFGGHIYGINADNEPGYGVFFNKRILQEAGYGENDLYDNQKYGTWDRAKFEEVLKACTKDSNGDGKTDIWGMTTSLGANYYTAMVYASEAAFVTKDAAGQFANQMGSEEFLSAMTWADDLRKDYGLPLTETSAGMASPIDRFINGEVAMMVATESDKQFLKSMRDDWGFVLIPDSDGEWPVSVDFSPVVFIPASFSKEEANEIAYVFSRLTDPIPFVDGGEWKENYYGVYRDPRAVDETLQTMKRGRNIKPRLELYVQGLFDNSIMNHFLYPLYAGETTPEEGIKANLEKWNGIIQKQNER
ncbi:MAG: extracellular solute-binding protein, partial [Clostridiales bacterium]|nr:extracellular solute-binding protein [Clostridiales bacterium]